MVKGRNKLTAEFQLSLTLSTELVYPNIGSVSNDDGDGIDNAARQ